MGKIEEARKLLGDDYVIVPLASWNHDVEEHKKLLSRLQMVEEENKKLREALDKAHILLDKYETLIQ